MDKKSKIFFIIFGLLIVGSVAVTYWRIMIKKDYIIEAQTDCDPTTEQCFVWECDPESMEEGEACTGDADADIWYYKIVKRNASRIPLCDPADEDCDALVCGESEPECEEILCNEDNKEDQEVECNNPEEYVVANPETEEEVECAEGDVCPIDEAGDDTTELSDEAAVCDVDAETCAVDAPEEVDGEVIQ
ncbi:hypothetical protein L6270_01530 [Candidatus Parcubacteria bacterium]|nr:hypothetical protein [Patescibacteria group bacterium]MBU4309821.1 hypothetical protein [Patescibacteria group bacterium]MBU4432231.1 hypothetical protein [Patescibacteria group bacterium]MBU4578160.1 hypothetical protein [Patescibacteria group bacterium]MCG2696697.1 hypothetical protein [Candidatus Parcubacteria bacterium]